jgi:two-component system NtrC family sensor kinase
MERLRILVVDDEEYVREIVAAVLSEDGHHTDMARNGTEALPLLDEHTYDLIVSDLRMPDIDGPALYREVERRYPDIVKRFIFITGTTYFPEYADFLKTTEDPVLLKTFNLIALRQAVAQVLARP